MSVFSTLAKLVRPLLSDSAVSWGAREYFNHKYEPLGKMTKLQIDATNQKASLEVELKGETQPLQITIQSYEVTDVGGKSFLEVKQMQTSREWMNIVAAELIKGGKLKFEIPEIARSV